MDYCLVVVVAVAVEEEDMAVVVVVVEVAEELLLEQNLAFAGFDHMKNTPMLKLHAEKEKEKKKTFQFQSNPLSTPQNKKRRIQQNRFNLLPLFFFLV